MGRLITIVGNSGSGKTTLTRELGKIPGFQAFLEEHAERPFQAAFMQDKHFGLANQSGLANQIDYLLYRAEQEQAVRRSGQTGVQDGGLDLDFHIFTKLFHRRGYLDDSAYALCERLYHTLRGLLPPPDLIVSLETPIDELARRKTARKRALDISVVQDLEEMQDLLQTWLDKADTSRLLALDTRMLDPETCIQKILVHIS